MLDFCGTRALVFMDGVTADGRSRRTIATNLRGHCFTVHIDEELKYWVETDLEDSSVVLGI